jgi:hypothetical protein
MMPKLQAEVEIHWPKDGDIDKQSSGVVDKDILKAEAEHFFKAGRGFTNYFQLKECANHFSAHWGFALAKYGGTQLACCFSDRDERDYKSKVPSPLKRGRQASIKETKRKFVICSSELNRDRNARGVSKDQQKVKIMTVILMHSELCNPSAEMQAIAKRAAGVYSGAISLDKMMDILDIIKGGGNTNSIRTLLRKHFPSRYALMAADIWNFKNRALRLWLNSDSNQLEDVEELLQFKGLDADFSIEIGRDIASQAAEEILCAALQDTNVSWKVEAYLRSLKEKDPYFDYRIARDAKVPLVLESSRLPRQCGRRGFDMAWCCTPRCTAKVTVQHPSLAIHWSCGPRL